MSSAIPFFSNLRAEKLLEDPRQKLVQRCDSLSARQTGCVPYLGLPFNTAWISNSLKKNNKKKQQTSRAKELETIFPPCGSNVARPAKEGLIYELQTDRILEKEFEQSNKTKFFDLASSEAIQSVAHIAEKRVKNLNPLAGAKRVKKAKRPDIFD